VGFSGLNLSTISESKKFNLNYNNDGLSAFNNASHNVNTGTIYNGVD
jgi:hypothetical protein